jgi:hypothetical protein
MCLGSPASHTSFNVDIKRVVITIRIMLPEKTLKGPFLILCNWRRLYYNGGAARGLWGIVVVVIYRSWQVRVIGLGRRLVDLRLRWAEQEAAASLFPDRDTIQHQKDFIRLGETILKSGSVAISVAISL